MINCRTHTAKKLASSAILLALLGVPVTLHSLTIATAADAPQSIMKIDEQRLVGRWVRPDGGYILEVKEIKKDGSLKAGYYNPRPINVARAEWNRKQGFITVFIELRDVNYPGSNYDLRYDPKADRLIGTYFQAVQKETYDIEFQRIK